MVKNIRNVSYVFFTHAHIIEEIVDFFLSNIFMK